ncbi:unnamed protein product [Gadus morhua 'NCC']
MPFVSISDSLEKRYMSELTKQHVVRPSEVSFTRLIMNQTEQTCLELLSTMEEKLRFYVRENQRLMLDLRVQTPVLAVLILSNAQDIRENQRLMLDPRVEVS